MYNEFKNICKLNSKSSECCFSGAIAQGLIGLSQLCPFIGASIPFHMPLIVSQLHDNNVRYGPEKRGGSNTNFPKSINTNSEPQFTGN